MYPSIETLKALLLKESYISEEDSKAAEASASDSAGYIAYLIQHELLSERLLGQAIAESYKLPFADLTANPPVKQDILSIPEQIARSNRVVVAKSNDKAVAIASDQPEKIDVKQINPLFKDKVIKLAYALPDSLDRIFSQYEQPLETRFSKIIESGQRVAPVIVDEIIKDAVAFHASDIHFEPQIDTVIIRFRVDGTLHQAGQLPKEQYENILNRIKVESGMRIDEHLSAQDGAMQRRSDEAITDLRVSLVPTVYGEKVVMRVLSSYVQGLQLDSLGLEPHHRQLLQDYSQKPFGMILTVGPTGSGKTTTLYSILRMLNKPLVNITTIEDPVEYKLPGINQIQVREQTNMTFARGLRAIVRQDPDIILVGEIRDSETAEIGVNAALTGHLLLSTFHANDAPTAIPRLIDMGIEPFLLASTLEVIIAQRLVRKICDTCRYSIPTQTALKNLANSKQVAPYLSKIENVYAGKGCAVCNNTGYRGRIAVFEFLPITPEMEELITTQPSAHDIWDLATRQGATSMFEDGIAKVSHGLTSIEELLRVVELPRAKTHV